MSITYNGNSLWLRALKPIKRYLLASTKRNLCVGAGVWSKSIYELIKFFFDSRTTNREKKVRPFHKYFILTSDIRVKLNAFTKTFRRARERERMSLMHLFWVFVWIGDFIFRWKNGFAARNEHGKRVREWKIEKLRTHETNRLQLRSHNKFTDYSAGMRVDALLLTAIRTCCYRCCVQVRLRQREMWNRCGERGKMLK